MAVAGAAVEQLERELVKARDRLAQADRNVRRCAIAVLTIDALGMACDIEQLEQTIAASARAWHRSWQP